MPKRSTVPLNKRTIIHQGPAADIRLHQLGIPGARPIALATHDGAAGARAATSYHPKSYAGQRMWGDTTAALRIYLEPVGWEPLHFMGVDLVLDRARGVAIIVTAGDAATGDDRYTPGVRYERREVIQGLINGYAATLFDAQQPPQWDVWFLLHYLTRTELRGELSKPVGISRTGHVSGWFERILLPVTPFGPGSRRQRREPTAVPAVNVGVQRRAG